VHLDLAASEQNRMCGQGPDDLVIDDRDKCSLDLPVLGPLVDVNRRLGAIPSRSSATAANESASSRRSASSAERIWNSASTPGFPYRRAAIG
jgi:hypothetical protein